MLADGPGGRLEAARVADEATSGAWTALMLAVDVLGGTVRAAGEARMETP